MLDHHPFDVVGWDGYFYPWAFNIHDFEPIVGRIHQPPPVHQTFQGDGFVICSFCPRPYDFDPNAVPAPYNHSNVDSDEVLLLRLERVHEPQGHRVRHRSRTTPTACRTARIPGRAEASIGAKHTNELAVMMDTFRPLHGRQGGAAVRGSELLPLVAARNCSERPCDGVPGSARALLGSVVDYAGLFPPTSATMADAVAHYAGERAGADQWMLGRFVVPAARLAEFDRRARALRRQARPGG